MTNEEKLESILPEEEAIKIVQELWRYKETDKYTEAKIRQALDMAIKALKQELILDKLDVIITDALDKSTNQKESQTLRWVLDMISEVSK